MNRSEFEFEGKTYIAVEGDEPCIECALYGGPSTPNCLASDKSFSIIPACSGKFRSDGRSVIFKEKQ
jgi:hypothetical protein